MQANEISSLAVPPHPLPKPKLWVPKRVLVTPSALGWEHGRAAAERAAALGAEVVELKADRLPAVGGDERQAYREAKATLAVVTASASKRRLQPIPPSADWRFDLAAGCPAHCSYCYLAGSLAGPPIVRAYANLPEILAELPPLLGQGRVTSRSASRAGEGTTFEASCYTDPLALEHLTGSLGALVEWFGRTNAPAQLRFTTKYDAVGPLLGLPHGRRTRIRFSVNARAAERFEGGAPRMRQRLSAMRQAAMAGYRIGLTVAPIMPLPDWHAEYAQLLAECGAALEGTPDPDLTVEMITHRFTDGSREVLQGWYPGSPLEMDPAQRAQKRTKFGGVKHVFPRERMQELRAGMERALSDHLPQARRLYWT